MHHRNSIQYHLGTRFEIVMRVKPPLLRRSFVPPDQAPILRYAVAILSVDLILALILVTTALQGLWLGWRWLWPQAHVVISRRALEEGLPGLAASRCGSI